MFVCHKKDQPLFCGKRRKRRFEALLQFKPDNGFFHAAFTYGRGEQRRTYGVCDIHRQLRCMHPPFFFQKAFRLIQCDRNDPAGKLRFIPQKMKAHQRRYDGIMEDLLCAFPVLYFFQYNTEKQRFYRCQKLLKPQIFL